MRLKLTFFLLLLNLTLFGYIFYLESGRSPSESASRLIFPAGSIEQAQSISIVGPDAQTSWKISRLNDRWMVEEPVEWPANAYAAQQMLNLLSFLKWDTRFSTESVESAGRTLEDYGLGESASQLKVESRGEVISLAIGSPTEIGNRIYLLSPDKDLVYVVSQRILKGTELSPSSFISKKIVHIPPFEAREVYVQAGASNSIRVQFTRDASNWMLNAPIRVAADSSKMDTALAELENLEARDFFNTTPPGANFSNPWLRININGNNRQQTLLVGDIFNSGDAAGEPMRYAKLEAYPTVFTVNGNAFEQWITAQESLRQRHFMEFSPERADAIEIRFDESSLSLQRLESGRWQVVHSENGNLLTMAADEKRVEHTLQRLSRLEAIQFVSDAPSAADLERFGFNEPQRRIAIRLRDGQSRTLIIGQFGHSDISPTPTSRLYAKRSSSTSVYLVSNSILADLQLNPLHYRDRVVATLPDGARIDAIRLRDIRSGRTLLEFQRDEALKWAEIFPTVGDEKIRNALEASVAAVRRFEVDRYVHNHFSDPLRLDAETVFPWCYALEADAHLEGGSTVSSQRIQYFFTERKGGASQFAGSRESDLTFIPVQSLIDALDPIFNQEPRPDAEINPEPDKTAPALPITPPSEETSLPQ